MALFGLDYRVYSPAMTGVSLIPLDERKTLQATFTFSEEVELDEAEFWFFLQSAVDEKYGEGMVEIHAGG